MGSWGREDEDVWGVWSLAWALAPSLNVHLSLVRLFCSLQGISGRSMRSCGAGGDTEWSRVQRAEERGSSELLQGLQRAKGFGAVRIW